MIVKPKIRGFICTTSHPDGCAAHVQEQIDYVKSKPKQENGPKNVLVIGAEFYDRVARLGHAQGELQANEV